MKKRGDADAAGASDAARLFADRASHAQPRFTLSDDAAALGIVGALGLYWRVRGRGQVGRLALPFAMTGSRELLGALPRRPTCRGLRSPPTCQCR